MTVRAESLHHPSTALADHIDFGHLERYTMGEPALTQELLRTFCEEMRAFILSEREDASVQRRALHRLKGSARAVGAFPLADAAEWLEKVLEVNAPAEDVRDARAELEERLAAVREACRAWKDAMGY